MVLGVGAGQSQAQCQTWVNTHGITHPVLADAGSAIYNLFGNGFVPYNAIMDCEDVVLLTASGFNETQVRNTIQSALSGVIAIDHMPLGDTEETGVPIPVTATISASTPFVTDHPAVNYRVDGGLVTTVPMTLVSGNDYRMDIPGQAEGADVEYNITAVQEDGCPRTYPGIGQFFGFHVGPDEILPVITHIPVTQVTENQLPLTLFADVTDNMGVANVYLEYQVNGGGFSTIEMVATDAMYMATISDSLVIGDSIDYRIHAIDISSAGNESYAPTEGYYMMEVIDRIPVVIIDLDGAHGSGPAIQTAIEANLGSAAYMTSMPTSLGIYQSAFVCLGVYGSSNHTLSGAEGEALAAFMDAGGSVYMEGGDTWAYDPETDAHPYFKINGTNDGSSDAGPQLNGQDGSLAEGMVINYSSSQGYNSYIDKLAVLAGGVSVFKNSSPVYDNVISYDGGTYKTVGSSVLFGGMSNNANTTTQAYMDSILQFFGLGEPMPTPTPSAEPCLNHGDVTLDGELTAGDAQLCFQIALGSYTPSFEEECAADCNGDDGVTAGDAQATFLAVLGSGSCEDPV